jgi:NADH dehydrogenase FAD-containing subunit
MKLKRREFLGGVGATLASAWLPGCGGGDEAVPVVPPAPAVSGSVIVVGGGMAGATVAKYLRLWGGDGIEVTLVERSSIYTSSIMSGFVLTGQRTLASLEYGYDALRTAYGITTVFGDVASIDPVTMQVTLVGGQVLSADRIILAPGIDYDEVLGLVTDADKEKMPHAWTAGPQTTLLADQLSDMTAGGNVIVTNPMAPYRCPPATYARACQLADWLNTYKPGSTVTFLDANADYVAAKATFQAAFTGLYAGVITYVPNAEVTAADPATMTLTTTAGNFQGDVINLIPRQRAGKLITDLGLNNSAGGRFAAVDVLSYASTVPGWEKVHIIGDSCGTPQPKAGHMGNQQAKVCADAIIRAFAGLAPDPAPVLSVTCYTNVTALEASWVSGVWQYDSVSKTMVTTPVGSFAPSVGWSGANFNDSYNWFAALMADSFA